MQWRFGSVVLAICISWCGTIPQGFIPSYHHPGFNDPPPGQDQYDQYPSGNPRNDENPSFQNPEQVSFWF